MPRREIDRRTFLKSASAGTTVAAVTPLLGPAALARSRETWRTGYVYDELYQDHLIYEGHPESPDRLVEIQRSMQAAGLDTEVTAVTPLADPLPFMRQVHTREHIDLVSEIPTTGGVALHAVAGLLGAVKAVSDGSIRNAFCAIRPPGHHAHNNGGEEGFCFYSNVAIAARYAQALGYAKVLIIDWDYHHGNGTQDVFYDDATVLFFSTHDQYAYPGTGDPGLTGEGEGTGLTINVHLPCGARDQDMVAAWEERLLPKVHAFRPDFILISAGFDSRQNDPLGCFDLTDDCYARITRTAMALADEYCEGRVVSALEGGYNVTGLASAVVTHVGTLLGREVDIETARVRYETGGRAGVKGGILHLPGVSHGNVEEIRVHDARGRLVRRIPGAAIRGPLVDLRDRTASGHYVATVRLRGKGPERFTYRPAR